jgi:F-type H+-transporting ATPase subunit a
MNLSRSLNRFPALRGLAIRLLASFALCAMILGGPVQAVAALTAEHSEKAGAPVKAEAKSGEHAEEAEHGLPAPAPEIFSIGPLKVTSSMIVTWIVTIGIIVFARFATRRMREVPEGAQNFWEWLVESLHNFLDEIIGHQLAHRTFWFFATIFVFILFTNWFGLLPFIGTVGWGVPTEQGGLTHIETPLFRGVSADLNMTLAMALIFFACWIYWAVSSQGVGGVIVHLFGNPARKEMKGFLWVAMAIVFFFVGLLEIISILFRPVSLSLRLYGNIYAGENLLDAMSNLVPGLAWLIPAPFYFMEVLVGLVQALVFMLLTAVFTLLICAHSEEEHH